VSKVETLQGVMDLIASALAGVDRASLQADTDLYDLGLDSTTAIGLMMAIEDQFSITFPDSMLTETTFQTPGGLCSVVELLSAG
jgi:acyl carrier protein